MSVERIHLKMDDRVSSLCGNGSERVVSKTTFLGMTNNPELCKRCLAKLNAIDGVRGSGRSKLEIDMEQQREALVIDIADRYTDGKQLPFDRPSLEDAEAMLTAEKPAEWWGGTQDVYEWALRALDEILECKNYMAGNVRDLHELIPSAN